VKTAYRSEKGAIAPLLMVVMIIGLVFGVYLIQQRTNLFSKASYTEPPPLVQDDFSVVPSPLGWRSEILNQTNLRYTTGYINNGYRIAAPLGFNWGHVSSLVNVGTSNFTVVSDVLSRSGGGIGIAFGSRDNQCSFERSYRDCYLVYFDAGGRVRINYLTDSISDPINMGAEHQLYNEGRGLYEKGKTYKIRVDRNGRQLKAWLSKDSGQSWQVLIPEFQLREGTAQGTWVGYMVVAQDDESYFDNFKVWRYGTLPEPSVVGVTTPSLTPVPSVSPTQTVTIINPGQLTVTCKGPFGSVGYYQAQFNWTPVTVPGKVVQNYTLRINKEPWDVWAPFVHDLRRDGSYGPLIGDGAFQVGNRLDSTITLSAGRYAGWDVTPGFVGETTEATQYKTFGQAFTCGG
jgi:hypothetical protein